MSHTYIYALLDPQTLQVRYIGKSDNPTERFLQHAKEAKRWPQMFKSRWIASIANRGLTPVLHILEKCRQEEWQEAETEWIAFGCAVEWPLTNSTAGGEGAINLSHDARLRTAEKLRLSQDDVKERLRTVHGTSITLEGLYTGLANKALFRDSEFGCWDALPGNVLRGGTHPKRAARNVRGLRRSGNTKRCAASSTYFGVSWDASRGKWRTVASLKGASIALGRFDTEVAAALAYDAFILENAHEYISLNFPTPIQVEI